MIIICSLYFEKTTKSMSSFILSITFVSLLGTLIGLTVSGAPSSDPSDTFTFTQLLESYMGPMSTTLAVSIALCVAVIGGAIFTWRRWNTNPAPAAKTRIPPHQCYVQAVTQAVTLNPQYSNGWINLGNTVYGTQTVTVSGTSYTKQDCYVQAVTVNSQCADAWFNLGYNLSGPQTVTVGETLYTKRDCYVQAVIADSQIADSWAWLGTSLSSTETVIVSETVFTQQDCYVQAVTLNPQLSNGWFNLGNTLSGTQTVIVSGTVFTQQDCYV
jgi:type IV secretory pathway VirB2 component (pilin)